MAGVVAISLGSKISDLDINGEFSGPDAIFQGHALWYLVSFVAYVFLLAYFRSKDLESS